MDALALAVKQACKFAKEYALQLSKNGPIVSLHYHFFVQSHYSFFEVSFLSNWNNSNKNLDSSKQFSGM